MGRRGSRVFLWFRSCGRRQSPSSNYRVFCRLRGWSCCPGEVWCDTGAVEVDHGDEGFGGVEAAGCGA